MTAVVHHRYPDVRRAALWFAAVLCSVALVVAATVTVRELTANDGSPSVVTTVGGSPDRALSGAARPANSAVAAAASGSLTDLDLPGGTGLNVPPRHAVAAPTLAPGLAGVMEQVQGELDVMVAALAGTFTSVGY